MNCSEEAKFRIVLIGPGSIHLVNYAELIGSDVEVHCITDTIIDCKLASSTSVYSLSLKPFFKLPFRLFRIRKKIKSIDPDIIHVHQANSCSLYALLASGKKPVLVTAWGSDILLMPTKIYFRWMLKFILRKGDAFTASSQHLIDSMRSITNMDSKEITLANFGICDDFPEVEKEKIIYSNRYLNPLYRIDRIITDFSVFAKTKVGSDWILVIAGSGTEEKYLRILAKESGVNEKIHFVGWLSPSENRLWYAKASIYISLPNSDSTSISLYEAMAAKCFPIVSELAANKEIISSDKNGILVKDGDTGFLERSMKMINTDVLISNRKLALERASKSANKNRFLSAYSNLRRKFKAGLLEHN
jgi:glycosyltransferase involved in cell wall biosynthesis